MISKILTSIWSFLRNKMIWVLLIAAILIIPFGYGASKVEPEAKFEQNLNPSSEEYKSLMLLKDNFSDQSIVILVKGDNVSSILSDQNMAAMKYITDKAVQNDKVLFALSPEYFVSMLKKFGQAPADAPPAEVVLDAQGDVKPTFKSFFPNQQNALVPIGLWKSIDSNELSDFLKEVEANIKQAGFDNNVQTVLTGLPVVMDYQAREMPKALNLFMGVGFLLMLIALIIFFRVRGSLFRRLLVLGLVGVSILFTFGMMGFLDIPMTTMSIVTLPILLGLGVDYAVQFHSRYDEESRKGKSANDCVVETLKHTGPPIVIAMLLCMAGLFSAVLVESPQTKYFGKSLVMGVGICMIVALSLLLGILYLMDKRHDDTRKPEPRGTGMLEKFIKWLLPKTVKFSVPIVIVALGLGTVGWVFQQDIKCAFGWQLEDDVQVIKDVEYLRSLSGGVSPLDVVVEADNVLDPQLLQWVKDKSDELNQKQGIALGPGHYVGSVDSIAYIFNKQFGGIPKTTEQANGILGMMPEPTWINFVTKDHTALHISVNNSSPEVANVEQTVKAMKEIFANPPAGATTAVTGSSTVGTESARLLDDTRRAIELWGSLFILIGLIIAFKFNIKRVIVAAFPVFLVLGWGALYMKASGMEVTLFMALLPAQMIAIGVEFTILLLMRYYEERDKGEEPVLAMTTAMNKIGRAILVSGFMVILGFSVLMLAFDFPWIKDFGLVTVLDMVLIIVSTLIVLPAVALLFDRTFDRKKKAVASNSSK